tara:strand:- start:331 stop:744 length:414 start_codon:yes stop_codon:yes gene_type:complete
MKSYKEFMTEAEKRIKMVRLHHGTSPESADKIKKSGFTGGEHGEVHTSTNPKTARGFGARYSKKPRNVTMLVPAKSIKNKPEKGSKAIKTDGQRHTDDFGRRHYSVALDPEYASKRIVKSDGRIQKPQIAKRYRDSK